jgi:DNA invertase Pin-like site-specific DNA recombinase
MVSGFDQCWSLSESGSHTRLSSYCHLVSEPTQGVDYISLTEHIDTTTPGGKLIFHLMGALTEFERDLIRERTNAGLAAARARGRVGERPRKLATNGKVALAQRLFADKKHSIDDICSTPGISRSTLYRYVREKLLRYWTREPMRKSSSTRRVTSFQVLPQIIVKKVPHGILTFTPGIRAICLLAQTPGE